MKHLNNPSPERETPLMIDVFGEKLLAILKTEGRVYRRRITPIRHAEQVTAPQTVETILSDGTLESVVDAQPGDWIVTGAEGERFVHAQAKFDSLYNPDGAGGFIPKERKVIAVQNPFKKMVQIVAPWGTPENPAYQTGGDDCYFVFTLNEQNGLTPDRYIIGDESLLLSNYEPTDEEMGNVAELRN